MTLPLNVVIASFRSPALLEQCLASLETARLAVSHPVEVYVARTGDGRDVERLFTDRPWATLIATDADADVPTLRGAGMLAAGGGWMAVTEDHCVVDDDWLREFSACRDTAFQVTGGGMGNARGGLVNWAAFFSEYGFFSSARPAGEGFSLVTGANALYAPDVSARVAAWAADGMWEDVIHHRLASDGARFRFLPGARVCQNTTYGIASFCIDRFEHGRDYATTRLIEHPDMSRTARILTTPLLPFVLVARVGGAAARESPMNFLFALPFTLLFLAAWSVGEAVGYVGGNPS